MGVGRGRLVGGGGGSWIGAGGRVFFRWEASPSLKHTKVAATTSSWNMPSQSGAVLRKNDICLYFVLQEGMSKL